MAIANTQEIISLLRLTIHQPKSNPKTGETQIPVIQIVRQLLSLVGYNLVRSTKKIEVQGKRRYTYQLESCISTPTRQSIFDYWLDRDEPNVARSRIAVEVSPEPESQCHDSPNIYNSTNSDEILLTEAHLPSESMDTPTSPENPCHDSPNIYTSTNSDQTSQIPIENPAAPRFRGGSATALMQSKSFIQNPIDPLPPKGRPDLPEYRQLETVWVKYQPTGQWAQGNASTATGTDTRNQPPEERTEQKPEPQENSDPDSKPATGTAKEEAAERERKKTTQTQREKERLEGRQHTNEAPATRFAQRQKAKVKRQKDDWTVGWIKLCSSSINLIPLPFALCPLPDPQGLPHRGTEQHRKQEKQ